jgi:uncharacterized membrane protein
MWMAPGETAPDRERQIIQSPKLMPTIVWNLRRFHVMKVLQKGMKFNSQYDTNKIVASISDWRQEREESVITGYGFTQTTLVLTRQNCQLPISGMIR